MPIAGALGSSCRRRPGGAVSPAAGGKTRAAGCGPQRLWRVEGQVSLTRASRSLGSGSSPLTGGAALVWTALHGALPSLALTRHTNFFVLGHRVQWGGCGAQLVVQRWELAGGGGASECALQTWSLGNVPWQISLSGIQIGESVSCRKIQAYPLPQVSNTSGQDMKFIP